MGSEGFDVAARAEPRGEIQSSSGPRPPAVGFDLKILLATVLPWSLAFAAYRSGIVPVPLAVLFTYLGLPHVMATTGLYADRGLRGHIVAHRVRYFLAPALTILGFVAAFAFLPKTIKPYVETGFFLWQTHHFTKQNVGMASFWLKARRMPGLLTRERRLIIATDAIGMTGIIRAANLWPRLNGPLRLTGLLAVAIGAAVALSADTWPRRLMLLSAVMFYAPLLFFHTNLFAAVAVYSVAHGAQYYLMVGQAVRDDRRAVLITIPTVLVGGMALARLGHGGAYGAAAWIFGLNKGIVASHFIADAGLWRLRDPDIRSFMKRRFTFLQ